MARWRAEYKVDRSWHAAGNTGIRDPFDTLAECVYAIGKRGSSILYRARELDSSTTGWEGYPADAKGYPIGKENMEYRVQVYDRRGCWTHSGRSYLSGDKRWVALRDALQSLVTHGSTSPKYRILNQNEMVVFEGRVQDARDMLDNPTKEMNMDLISDLPVINVDRLQLIEQLEPKLDAEVAKREAAAAEQQAKDAEFEAAVEDFSNAELAAIVRKYWTTELDNILAAKKSGTFTPKEVAVSQSETDLARAVRVLGISSDKSIELKPGTNLYNLI